MSDLIRNGILRGIRKLFDSTASANLTDADLLHRFVHAGDEAAFELLVWRHAALVLGVCRQILRDDHAVEDAFQATFLVLVKKAGSILHREALPGWLHRVAFRVALRARQRTDRHPATDTALDQLPAAEPRREIEPDVRHVLHEEILRLPARYRLPVVVCHLEGKSHEEAARELGWCKGTVAGRLSRARELLRRRLAGRGIEMGSVALAADLAVRTVDLTRWSGRIALLVQGLRGLAGSEPALAGVVSPGAIALAEGVLSTMFWTKIKWTVVGLCLLSVAGLSAGLLTERHGVAQESGTPGRRPPAVASGPAAVAGAAPQKEDDLLDEANQRMQSRRNLQALALAMHHYADTNARLPGAAIVDRTGKPLLSWRVALLPYLDQDALYREFKLNESWDSPHNKKLLTRMPKVFAPVRGKVAPAGRTYYQVFVGPGAVFSSYRGSGGAGVMPMGGMGSGSPMGGAGAPGAGGGPPPMGMGMGMPQMGGGPLPAPGQGPSWAEISDGTSNTFLIVEANDTVPWTKPEDVPFDARKPMPKLGGQFTHLFHVAFADGTVRAFPRTIPATVLRAAITANGGEAVAWNKVEGTPSGGALIRQQAIDRLKARNAALKEEAGVLRDILGELKAEIENLRWSAEEEKLVARHPATAALMRENEKLEKEMKETREQVRELLVEIRKLREETKKKPRE